MFVFLCFFFNDTATTEIYTYLHTLSLHDALPISGPLTVLALRRTPINPALFRPNWRSSSATASPPRSAADTRRCPPRSTRSEEHTSELQSLMRISYAVFCLKKKNKSGKQQHENDT